MQGELVRTAAGVGTTWLLAALLLVAAGAKVRHPEPIRRSIARLTPGQWLPERAGAIAADSLAAVEGVVGLTSLAFPLQPAPGIALALLYTAFLAAILRAHRLGIACGCFASLSTRTTGSVELARGWCLAVLAGAALAMPIGTPRSLSVGTLLLAVPFAGAGLGLTIAAMVAAQAAGERTLPRPRRRPRTTGWRRAGPRARRRALRALRADPTFRQVAGDQRGWWFQVQRVNDPRHLVRVVARKGRADLVLALDADAGVLVVSGRAPDGSLVSRLPAAPAPTGSDVRE